mmetsp:Transcript_2923/g.7446  ORF Transcript_2923/g.7446 Transcript_2923/m.7446 type:complete len:566 (+) Transcript_2923:794-2491(+)
MQHQVLLERGVHGDRGHGQQVSTLHARRGAPFTDLRGGVMDLVRGPPPQTELRGGGAQRRLGGHVPAGLQHGARALPGQVCLEGSDDGRYHPTPDNRAEGEDQVQGPRQEDRRVQAQAGGAAPRQDPHLRGDRGGRQRHALPEEGHDQEDARLQPPGRDERPHHPLLGEEAAALRLQGGEGEGVGAGGCHPLHQGGGRAPEEGGPHGGAQERERLQDICRQRLPHQRGAARDSHPLPRPLVHAAEARRGGRAGKRRRVRRSDAGEALRGQECQQCLLERGARGPVLLLGARPAHDQDGRLPRAPGEAPGLCGGRQGVQGLLPPLPRNEHRKRPPERGDLPVPREKVVPGGLRRRLHGRDRLGLGPAGVPEPHGPAARRGDQGLHPGARRPFRRPDQQAAGLAQEPRPRRPRVPRRGHRLPRQLPGRGEAVHQGGEGRPCHPHVFRPQAVGRGQALCIAGAGRRRQGPGPAPGAVGHRQPRLEDGRWDLPRVGRVWQGHRPDGSAQDGGRAHRGGEAVGQVGDAAPGPVRRGPARGGAAALRQGGLPQDGRQEEPPGGVRGDGHVG